MEARLTHCGSSESWAEDCRTKTRQWHPHPNSERTCDPCGRASQCKSFSARLQQTRNFLRQNPRSLRSRGRVLPFSESLLEVSQGLLLALHVRLLQKPFFPKSFVQKAPNFEASVAEARALAPRERRRSRDSSLPWRALLPFVTRSDALGARRLGGSARGPGAPQALLASVTVPRPS